MTDDKKISEDVQMKKENEEVESDIERVLVNNAVIKFSTNNFVQFTKEHFQIAIQSGAVIDSQYAYTPAHFKRLHLRIGEKIAEYEKENGVIETELPKIESKDA